MISNWLAYFTLEWETVFSLNTHNVHTWERITIFSWNCCGA